MSNHFKNSSFIYKLSLLIIVLFATFSLRIYLNSKLPVELRNNYPNHYLPALSYAVGGLDYDKLNINTKDYLIAGIDHDTKGKSSLKELDDFLNSKVNTLNINAIEKSITYNANIFKLLQNLTFETFGQYIAAFVWKIFGVSWSNLFYFYSFLSTLAGLSLFLVGRKITRSYWGGLFVLIAYTFSMPELYGGVWSIRNTSPAWFFAFTVTFFFVFTGVYKNKWLNYLSYYALGVFTLIGIGWRSDALLFFPIIMLFLIIGLFNKYRAKKIKFKSILIYFILFLMGSYSIISLNSKLAAPSAPLGFMHIALYADKHRSDIGQYENNFQNQFNDYQTKWKVQYYQKHRYPHAENVKLMQGQYGVYCLELYTKSLEHNIYQWVKTYPNYLLNTFILQDILMTTKQFPQYENKIIKLLWTIAVYLAITGALILLAIGIARYQVSFFVTFIFYYSIVYWSMLPMQKHIMIMSVPISVLSGVSLFFLLSAIFNSTFRKTIEQTLLNKKNMFVAIIVLVFILITYTIILYFSKIYSTEIKNDFISKIVLNEKDGKDVTKEYNAPFFLDQ